MAITSMDQLIAALPGQKQHVFKTAAATTVAGQWQTLWDRTGRPTAGTLTIGNTTNGLIPTSATLGAVPFVNPPGGSKTYLARMFSSNTTAGLLQLYDRVFHAGSFSCAALTTLALSAQPALTRYTTGEDIEIWLEINTVMAAAATTIAVTYTNSAGVAGRSTGATVSLSGVISGAMIPLPLQSGDLGVQKIESVIVGGATNTGTVNVVLVRKLSEVGLLLANTGVTLDALSLGMPEVQSNACLAFAFLPSSTTTGLPLAALDIVTG